jgi:hypothetical protein
MHHREALLVLICIAVSATSQAAEIEVRTLGVSGGSAKALSERCAGGDYLVNQTAAPNFVRSRESRTDRCQ